MAQRVDICFSRVLETIVLGKAAMIVVDVGVTTCSIDVIVEGFGRAAQSIPRSFEVRSGSALIYET